MIFGFHGVSGSGKDTAAKRLTAILDKPVIEVSYARALKESVAALLGISLEQIEEMKRDPQARVKLEVNGRVLVDVSFRKFLQRYGTESHRLVFGDDFWVDLALPPDGDYSDAVYAVTDCRFPNEAARIRALGGKIVHVVGPEPDLPPEERNHESEFQIACDFTIVNRVRDDGFRTLDRGLCLLLERFDARPVLSGC